MIAPVIRGSAGGLSIIDLMFRTLSLPRSVLDQNGPQNGIHKPWRVRHVVRRCIVDGASHIEEACVEVAVAVVGIPDTLLR